MYDVIGGWYGGVDSAAFAKDLAALDVATINLHINSPGGDVFEARAMVTALRAHKARVVATVDGLAASAASYVMLAADEVQISEGAFVMVHNAWGVSVGNKKDHAEMAGLLAKIDDSIVAEYLAKTGKSEADIRAWMDAETWFSAAEAQAAGLVDVVVAKPAAKASAWNLAAYANAPKALVDQPPPAEPVFDRAAAERRLRLLEKLSA